MDIFKDTIMNKLYETEAAYNVSIPVAVESGSRAWGFASPDSDYDCRFIYVNKRDWYLSVFDHKDIISYDADGIFDINGWDIKKAVRQIVKSNAAILEWLSSEDIYIMDKAVWEMLHGLSIAYFNPIALCRHYLSMALKKYSEILKNQSDIKKYFYVLRPLACIRFIVQYKKMPYMNYEKNLNAIDVDKDVKKRIYRLLDVKKASREQGQVPEDEIINGYIREMLDKADGMIKGIYFQKNEDYTAADEAFRKIIEMAWDNDR